MRYYFLHVIWAAEAAVQCDLSINCVVAWLGKWNKTICWTFHFWKVNYHWVVPVGLCGTKNAVHCKSVLRDWNHILPTGFDTLLLSVKFSSRSNPNAVGAFCTYILSFTFQIKCCPWPGESCFPFLCKYPFLYLMCGSGILAPALWDVGPAVLERGFSDLGLQVFRKNTPISDVRGDFR